MKTFTNATLKFCLVFSLGLLTNSMFAQVAFFINSPASLEGTYTNIGLAADGFGSAIDTTYMGDLALVNDGSLNPTEGCNALTNGADISGNIALIDRGSCEFGTKVLNAEAEGAIAVVICNNVAGEPITMGAGAVGAQATIPSVMITLDFCNQIKMELANGPVNISLSNAFNLYGSAAAYAYMTPIDHVVELQDISAIISNRSTADQSNIVVSCEITDPMGTVTTVSETINTLPAGMDSLVTITDTYTPTMLGDYTARFYNNGTGIMGYEQGVDEEMIGFTVTADQFGLDDNLQNPGGITIGGGGNFGMGSYYTMGENTEALSATFAISQPDSILGEFLTVTLYQADANNDDDPDENGDGNFDDSDLNPIAFNSYEVTAADVEDALIDLPLDNFISLGDPITLDMDNDYIIAVEYIGNNFFFITASGSTTYPDIGSVVKQGTSWFLGGFTSGINGVIRLNILPSTINANTPLLDEDQISLMPNPASDYVNIDLDLKEISEQVTVTLMDVTGRIVETTIHNNIQQEVLRMDTQNLTAGTYFVNVQTAEGMRTMKLSVVRNR